MTPAPEPAVSVQLNCADLYRAQQVVKDAMDDHTFTRYNKGYISKQELPTKIYCYASNFFSKIAQCLSFISRGLTQVADAAVNFCISLDARCLNLGNTIYPINQVNGKRHFVCISRSIEKVFGSCFYSLATSGMFNSWNREYFSSVDEVFGKMVSRNGTLLHSQSTEQKNGFEYKVRTIDSHQINAFACPAGGMVVYEGIINKINETFDSSGHPKIKDTKVHLGNGSTITVNLQGVRKEDVIAALIGHEMTHVASRHGMVSIIAGLVRRVGFDVLRIVGILYLKNKDPQYQDLLAQKSTLETLDSKQKQSVLQRLRQKETSYNDINELCIWLQERVEDLKGLLHSRDNEYEADITGAYLAQRAGYSTLGALYLQEFLAQGTGEDFFHKNFEFFFTHPYSENRKRALLAGITEFNIHGLADSWTSDDSGKHDYYDNNHTSKAVNWANTYLI